MKKLEVPLRIHHLDRIKKAMEIGAVATSKISLLNAKVPVFPENTSERTQEYVYYYFDLFGEFPDGQSDILTNKAEVERAGKLRCALEKYLNLPKTTPLRLTSCGQDWICGCAIAGSHCFVKSSIYLSYERELAEKFGARKEELKIPGPYFYKHIRSEGVSVATQMGVVMEILKTLPSISYLFFPKEDNLN